MSEPAGKPAGFFSNLSNNAPKSLAVAVASAGFLFVLQTHIDYFHGTANYIAEAVALCFYLAALLWSLRTVKAANMPAEGPPSRGIINGVCKFLGILLSTLLIFFLCIFLSFAYFGWLD